MLPDGTLVVPIRGDADGSDDEEELSGIIEVNRLSERERSRARIAITQIYVRANIVLIIDSSEIVKVL